MKGPIPMTHSKDESPPPARKETSLTKRGRRRAAAACIVTAGATLGVGIVFGVVEPEVAAAVVAVCGLTATATKAVLRRSSAPDAGTAAEE
ncbi:hypothetical protein ABT358_02455 [Streptomyces sp. NPDC000341]|uniref:hypothetical protein n=1 Tax=Streptomyces sp. NPDC000341 TaxID=3156645 RepID=UPI003320E6E0